MAPRKNNTSIPLIVLMLLIGLLGGAAGMYFYNQLQPDKLTNEMAKVKFKEGLYVFINSEPVKKRTRITNHQTTIFETINKLFSKAEGKNFLEKLGDKMGDIGTAFVFEQKLSEELRKIKSEHSEADGVIFDDKLNECEVFSFKKD